MTDPTSSEQRYQPPEGLLLMTAEQAAVFNEPTRTDIMMMLAARPATTKQLAEALEKPKGTVGHHLKALEEAGLIAVVRTRQVRAITEKYYGRLARTYMFPHLDEGGTKDHGFLAETLQEARYPHEGETGMFTLRRARVPVERADEFIEVLIRIAEEFASAERGGDTVYGFLAGVYPTDRPSLREDDE